MSTPPPGGPTDVSGADIPFTPGQAIPLVTTVPPAADFGAQVVINGAPAAGDTFAITPSTNKSVFQTMQDLIDLLHAPIGSPAARTAFSGQLAGHLTNLDQAMANVSRVHSSVGARMQELDALSSNTTAVDIQYQQMLSDLQDLDYVKAISDFTRQQVSLEAAQKSFVQISGLSLFNYL
jgi:flagellar hook-associated protein 3 FlgL